MRGTHKLAMIAELVEIVIAYASVQIAGLYFLSRLYLS